MNIPPRNQIAPPKELPTWYEKGKGWCTYADTAVKPKKIRKAFVWPHGGPRRGKLDRLCDILTGKGPDIFIAMNANRPVSAIDGPSQTRWSKWPELETNPLTVRFDRNGYLGTVRAAGERDSRKRYDFKTRRYVYPYEGMWTSATFCPQTKKCTAARPWPDIGGAYYDRHRLGHVPGVADPRNFHEGFTRGQHGAGGYYHPALKNRSFYWFDVVPGDSVIANE